MSTSKRTERTATNSKLGAPRRNVELKAKVADLNSARATAEELSTEKLGSQIQTDTYFECQDGRLKLREIETETAQLIWYRRADNDAPRLSHYCLVEVSDPVALKRALGAALGVRVVVSKRRDIYLFENVRIHLDDVEGIGRFLEFEAVLSVEDDEAAGRKKIDDLREQFKIPPADLRARSYADMA